MDANISLLNLSTFQLRKAADLKERIEALHDELSQLLEGGSHIGNGFRESGGEVSGGKRKMSAAGRARIGAAARARWAKIRAAKGAGSAVASTDGTEVGNGRKKRTMSPAARKKIAAAAKARWAKVRAAQGK